MAAQTREVVRVVTPEPVVEGAGVHLRRSIATPTLDHVDPFLLLDHFHSVNPTDYEPGFPFHPHRGIETVTYVLEGEVRHGDSLGNRGAIGNGDVQWMTAGSGILHEEMPQVKPEGIHGFQLWVNLPAREKMTRPRYQEIRSASIPEASDNGGARVRVVAGRAAGEEGPVTGIAAEPLYLDVALAPKDEFRQAVPRGHAVFAYVFEGEGRFGGPEGKLVGSPRLVLFGDGDRVEVRAGEKPVRFLLAAAKPWNEPIARYGPFVMNTRQEIEDTLRDLRSGRFIRREPGE
jgi:redox-sensitive bicupin YhaK (pirin superfamily)